MFKTLQQLTELWADQVEEPGEHDDTEGDKSEPILRWDVTVKRADGKTVQKKFKARTLDTVKQYYGKDFVSAEQIDENLEEQSAKDAEAGSMTAVRQNMIDRIEGYFGALQSVPYHEISTEDLKKIYDTLVAEKQINAIR